MDLPKIGHPYRLKSQGSIKITGIRDWYKDNFERLCDKAPEFSLKILDKNEHRYAPAGKKFYIYDVQLNIPKDAFIEIKNININLSSTEISIKIIHPSLKGTMYKTVGKYKVHLTDRKALSDLDLELPEKVKA